MWAILSGEFFWGVVVDLVLSFVGAWAQARIAERLLKKRLTRVIRDFSVDTIKNITGIISELESTRDKGKVIHHDFLNLIDIELGIFGRNREHLLNLPDPLRTDVRKFINDVGLRRAGIGQRLQQFSNLWQTADDIQAQGRGPEAQRKYGEANAILAEAHKAADKLVTTAGQEPGLVAKLLALKI